MEENICTRCSKGESGGVSSCVSPFIEDKNPGFWLTLTDVTRIVKNTKLDPDQFCRFVELIDDKDEDEALDDRHVDLMSVDNKNILMNGDKKCFFLGPKGCTIFEDRPKNCRVFPFWFKEKGNEIEIIVLHEDSLEEDECLITKLNYKSDDVPRLLSLMNESEESMKACIKEYIKEMELNAKFKDQLEHKSILWVLKDNGFVDKELKVKTSS